MDLAADALSYCEEKFKLFTYAHKLCSTVEEEPYCLNYVGGTGARSRAARLQVWFDAWNAGRISNETMEDETQIDNATKINRLVSGLHLEAICHDGAHLPFDKHTQELILSEVWPVYVHNRNTKNNPIPPEFLHALRKRNADLCGKIEELFNAQSSDREEDAQEDTQEDTIQKDYGNEIKPDESTQSTSPLLEASSQVPLVPIQHTQPVDSRSAPSSMPANDNEDCISGSFDKPDSVAEREDFEPPKALQQQAQRLVHPQELPATQTKKRTKKDAARKGKKELFVNPEIPSQAPPTTDRVTQSHNTPTNAPVSSYQSNTSNAPLTDNLLPTNEATKKRKVSNAFESPGEPSLHSAQRLQMPWKEPNKVARVNYTNSEQHVQPETPPHNVAYSSKGLVNSADHIRYPDQAAPGGISPYAALRNDVSQNRNSVLHEPLPPPPDQSTHHIRYPDQAAPGGISPYAWLRNNVSQNRNSVLHEPLPPPPDPSYHSQYLSTLPRGPQEVYQRQQLPSNQSHPTTTLYGAPPHQTWAHPTTTLHGAPPHQAWARNHHPQ